MIRYLLYTLCFSISLVLGSAQPAVLATGKWFKISVQSDGIYQINYSLLKKLGIDPSKVNPTTLKLYGYPNGMLPQANSAARQKDLRELAILVTGEGDGKFNASDRIIFYGQGPDVHTYDVAKETFWYENNLYSDKNFYFLTYDGTVGKRIGTQTSIDGSFPVVNEFNYFVQFEEDLINILHSGREWFGFSFGSTNEATIEFSLPGVSENSEIALISKVMARTYDASSFNLFYNNVPIGTQDVPTVIDSQYGLKGRMKSDTVRFTAANVSGTNATHRIKYQFVKSNNAAGYLDNFLVSVKRKLALYENLTLGTLYNANTTSTIKLESTQDLTVWDISDAFEVKNQEHNFNASQITFNTNIQTPKQFGWFKDDASLAMPDAEGKVINQNLQTISNPNLIIITPSQFVAQAERLAAHRQWFSNISSAIVTPEQIFNEYSGGRQDVSAMRDFIRDVYLKANGNLKYVLLFGRGSYDYKDREVGNTNLVPVYSSRNSLSPLETYSSDDFYGFMDANEGEWSETGSFNHTLDLGVGRVPAYTLEAAEHFVDKVIEYEANTNARGQWRSDIAFVADDGDGNLHQRDANQLATYVESVQPALHARKVYLDMYTQIQKSFGQVSPQATSNLFRVFHEGALIINFTGHGSEQLWMQERMLDEPFPAKAKNRYHYPFLITATCEFGRVEDPGIISAAEKLLVRKNAGVIGLVSSSRPVNSFTNYQLNLDFYEAFLVDEASRNQSIGTVFQAAKNKGTLGVANRNFSLLGDPSMTIGLSANEIEITTLANTDNESTLEGTTPYIIEGKVTQNETTLTDFNGEAEIRIYQGPSTKITKGDENSPFHFTEYDALLFQGKATVTDGLFSTTFITPKLNTVNPSVGRIVIYAVSNDDQPREARGSSMANIGTTNNDITDSQPPSISLFINDTTFVNGGIANENPILIGLLEDNTAIDISGTVPKQILATLDGDSTFNVTNYYQAYPNETGKGRITFQLFSLDQGKHQIILKAFDVAGNERTATVDFTVGEQNQLTVSKVFGWPNPFQDQVKIGFFHNRSGEDLEGQLVVCNSQGQPVLSLQFETDNSMFSQEILEWDGTMANGAKLPTGLYILRLSVRSALDGSKSEVFGKLVLTN